MTTSCSESFRDVKYLSLQHNTDKSKGPFCFNRSARKDACSAMEQQSPSDQQFVTKRGKSSKVDWKCYHSRMTYEFCASAIYKHETNTILSKVSPIKGTKSTASQSYEQMPRVELDQEFRKHDSCFVQLLQLKIFYKIVTLSLLAVTQMLTFKVIYSIKSPKAP